MMEGELRVVIEETILTVNVETETVFAPECARLLTDRTDERATTKTVQT